MEPQLLILAAAGVAIGWIVLKDRGMLDLFATVRNLLEERKAERLPREARQELAERRAAQSSGGEYPVEKKWNESSTNR